MFKDEKTATHHRKGGVVLLKKTSRPHAVPSRSQIVHKTQDALMYHPRRTPSLARRRRAPGHLQLAAFSSPVSIITHMFTRLSITKAKPCRDIDSLRRVALPF